MVGSPSVQLGQGSLRLGCFNPVQAEGAVQGQPGVSLPGVSVFGLLAAWDCSVSPEGCPCSWTAEPQGSRMDWLGRDEVNKSQPIPPLP